ncbi:MAG: hypothetical protein Kow0037_23320 [Calditrichia bacterium]
MAREYGHWYDGRLYHWLLDRSGSPLHRRLIAAVPPGSAVLDIGCGSGGVVLGLAEKCRKVIGVDASRGMIRAAERRRSEAGFSNVRFEESDALEYLTLTNEHFDYIIYSLVLHEMNPDLRLAVLQNSRRVSGRILVQDYATPINSRKWRWITRAVERLTSPQHYNNFLDFQQNGGLLPLLEKEGYEVESDRLNRQGFLRITVAH